MQSETLNKIDEDVLTAFIEQQKKIYHFPVSLGINEFKRLVKETPGMSRSVKNKLIASYKKRSWIEFDLVARGRGNAPTYKLPNKKKINVSYSGEVHEVKVNGK